MRIPVNSSNYLEYFKFFSGLTYLSNFSMYVHTYIHKGAYIAYTNNVTEGGGSTSHTDLLYTTVASGVARGLGVGVTYRMFQKILTHFF